MNGGGYCHCADSYPDHRGHCERCGGLCVHMLSHRVAESILVRYPVLRHQRIVLGAAPAIKGGPEQ